MKAMGIDDGITEEIVRRVTGAVPAERIILFGSAATEQMTRDSDIDLLVIQESVKNPFAGENRDYGRSGHHFIMSSLRGSAVSAALRWKFMTVESGEPYWEIGPESIRSAVCDLP